MQQLGSTTQPLNTFNMFKLILLSKIIILCFLAKYESARILAVFPTPSISHQVTFRPLTRELTKRGHEVVVITTDPVFSKGRLENYTEIDVHDISYKIWADEFMSFMTTGKKNNLKEQLYDVFAILNKVFEAQMKSKEVQKIIKKETKPFDLILVEGYMIAALGFSHIYKVPVILVSSLLPFYTDLRIFNLPDHPILYPAVDHHKIDNLSILERIKELFSHFSVQKDVVNIESACDKVVKGTFGSDVPSLSELYNNVAALFLNSFRIWDSNRPVPPSNIQYLGGMHMKPTKELPQDLKLYLDSSKNGVIYISFGTNVIPSTLNPEKIQMMINVLSRLPYEVLWKWDKDELPGRSKNIRISKWFPQSDLLRHPKIKLFITQGGLQSTDEAIVAGVPLLGIPVYGDQWYNTAMYVRHKIGVHVELEDLNEENFKAAIDTLCKDNTYPKNIQNLRATLYDRFRNPLERAVWWTEHVLRHGGARHLRSPAANMPWTEYYEIELVAYLLLVVVGVLVLSILLLTFLLKVVIMFSNKKRIKRN